MMLRRLAAVVLAASLVLLTACTGGIAGQPLKPKAAPPVIGEEGTLRVAIDLSYPPFGGTVRDTKAGLDVDVAAALAESLGLKLVIVDADPSVAAEMVKAGKADVAFGAYTVEQTVAGGLAFAGTYATDAPAVFGSKPATLTIADLGGKRIAVQKDSLAYWVLADEYGEEALLVAPSLRDAMTAVAGGQADLAAGDAIVGSYLTRDVPGVVFNGQIGAAYPLGAAVSKDNAKLEALVRSALDDAAAKGVLATLRRKWVGDLPALTSPKGQAGEEPTQAP